MRTNRVFALTAMVLFLSAASVSYGGTNDLVDYYFVDDVFVSSHVCGYFEKECDNTPDEWGTRTDWRTRLSTSCTTGEQTYTCQHFNGAGWEAVECTMRYDEGVRLRIPIG